MRRSLVLAVAASLAAIGAAALPAADTRGPEVAVSQADGPQDEVGIAIDPTDHRVLVAGSNSSAEGTMRSYGSTDGGATWTSALLFTPGVGSTDTCAADPAVGIDRRGRQFFAFLRATACRRQPRPKLFVASREGPAGAWVVPARPAVPYARDTMFDDKPGLAVDTTAGSPYVNRVYIAWTRIAKDGVGRLLLAHSDDGGVTWSEPVQVNHGGREVSYASIATGPFGDVYVAWNNLSEDLIFMSRSTDGGDHFGLDRLISGIAVIQFAHCASGTVIPAAGASCVRPNPIVSVDTSSGPYRGRVYVTYANGGFSSVQEIFVTALNRRLRTLLGFPYGRDRPPQPVAGGRRAVGDRFWAASAVDAATGRFWVCFYDSQGDPRRRSVFYTCTASSDGGRTWAQPVRAAGVASNETVAGADPRQYGDYEGLAVVDGVAHPAWTDSRDLARLGEEIYTTTLTDADAPAPSQRRTP